jgi:hypothetical protein
MTEKKKQKGRQWDGKSRVSNDLYRKNFDEIFKKGIVNNETTLQDLKKILDKTKEGRK